MGKGILFRRPLVQAHRFPVELDVAIIPPNKDLSKQMAEKARPHSLSLREGLAGSNGLDHEQLEEEDEGKNGEG